MPDILIRGMRLPREGYRQVFITAEGKAVYFPTTPRNGELRFDVVELPEHGDLIDRDALTAIVKNFCNQANGGMAEMMMGRIVCYVEESPVIVPASEEANHDEP